MATRLEDALAARLRQLARAKKVPLSHVADRAGLARSYFWSLLNSSNSATLAVVQRLAEALGVEPLELLDAAEPIENVPEPPTAVVAVKTAPKRVAADADRPKAIKTAGTAPATPRRTRTR